MNTLSKETSFFKGKNKIEKKFNLGLTNQNAFVIIIAA